MHRLLLTLALLLGLAGPAAADPALVGKWSGAFEGGAIVMTLAADGSLEMSNSGVLMGSGSWAAADGRLTLTLTRPDGGGAETLSCGYTLAGETLQLTGEDPDCSGAPLFTRTG